MYNAAGELIRTLAKGDLEAGFHTFPWDGRGDTGTQLASGVYFFEVVSKSLRGVGTVILIR
jgi:flagellar hook assembly protein FlgD